MAYYVDPIYTNFRGEVNADQLSPSKPLPLTYLCGDFALELPIMPTILLKCS